MSEKEIKTIIINGDTRPHFGRIKHLIQQEGVDINQVGGYFNWNLLTTAACRGDLACVEFLIENGANIDHRDSAQWTPLHHAASKSHLEVIKYLIQHGAFIDALDNCDRTPFWFASSHGNVDIIQYLLDMGADHSIPDDCNETPLQIAERREKTQVADLLRQHTQEKVKIGKQRRQQQLQQQKQEQQKQQLQLEQRQVNHAHDDPLLFDGFIIRSSNELKLVIAHLEKQLDLFAFSNEILDPTQMNQYHANKTQHDALLEIMMNNGEERNGVFSFQDLLKQIDQLKQEMNQRTFDFRKEWVSHDDASNPELEKMRSNYLGCMTKMKEKMSALCSQHVMGFRAFEQRRIAMGQW